MGNGNNTFNGSGGLSVGRNFRLIDGSGSTAVVMRNTDIAGSTTVSLGGGLHDVQWRHLDFDGSVRLITSPSGRIDMELGGARFNGPVSIRSGNQADQLRIDSQTRFVGRTTVIDLRGGNDELTITEAPTFNSRTDIRMGAGRDEAFIFGASSDDRFSFRGDAGNDRLILTASTFESTVILNGGSNTDQIAGEANDFASTPRVISFEIQ